MVSSSSVSAPGNDCGGGHDAGVDDDVAVVHVHVHVELVVELD